MSTQVSFSFLPILIFLVTYSWGSLTILINYYYHRHSLLYCFLYYNLQKIHPVILKNQLLDIDILSLLITFIELNGVITVTSSTGIYHHGADGIVILGKLLISLCCLVFVSDI